ncbi:hypothetical protein IV417_14685 [Alphaproteobacteria bacterium KMM 3653]|uniref:GIY-YIG domain-containing protein n=1 Tax=Harenicola maris TaxID=2841044 RepID=A0AAP2G9Q7_9RHOB|nr:hypothetical protein [Harenicola maris]
MSNPKPDWMAYITWQNVHRYRDLVEDRSVLTNFNGFYAFGLDKHGLQKGRVLYIGECQRAGGFRSRFGDYLKADPTKPGTRHKGALFLQDFRLSNSDVVWVRFCNFETDKVTRRDLEAAMMQYYLPWFNTRDMNRDTPFDTV